MFKTGEERKNFKNLWKQKSQKYNQITLVIKYRKKGATVI